jgi:hypothetical protein
MTGSFAAAIAQLKDAGEGLGRTGEDPILRPVYKLGMP